MLRTEKIETFRALHHGPQILVLPNAWDVVSARIFEDAGFPAIATSSAGVAFTLGYPDGQEIPRDEMLNMVARIARAVDVPVTADVEGGYGDTLATAKAVVQAGAVGMNLEDVAGLDASSHVALETQVAHIRHIRAKTDLVINARTDIFLLGIGDRKGRFHHTVERLNAYLEAGADCVFAPGINDAATIEKLVGAVHGPLNVLGVPGTPPAADLEAMGVARVSVGSGPARMSLSTTRHVAEQLRDSGSFDIFASAIPYAEVNALLKKQSQ